MATKQTAAPAAPAQTAQQLVQAASQAAMTANPGATYGWRVVVRGNTANGPRKRYVHTVQACSAGTAAHNAAGAIAAATMAQHGLQPAGLFHTVYPPVGLLCNGGVSKGWQALPCGTLQRVGATS